jgi:hypothetical protein
LDADGFYKVHRWGKSRAEVAKNGKKARKNLVMSNARNVQKHPEDYEVYDVGKTIDRHGNLVAPHQVIRNVPGVHPVTMPDNYVPQPEDRRINDAVAEANQARDRFNVATQQTLDQVNAFREAVEQSASENPTVKAAMEKAFGADAHKADVPPPTASSDAAKAGAAAADSNDTELAAWGAKLNKK